MPVTWCKCCDAGLAQRGGWQKYFWKPGSPFTNCQTAKMPFKLCLPGWDGHPGSDRQAQGQIHDCGICRCCWSCENRCVHLPDAACGWLMLRWSKILVRFCGLQWLRPRMPRWLFLGLKSQGKKNSVLGLHPLKLLESGAASSTKNCKLDAWTGSSANRS
jgi:hypothetical protein